MVLMNGAHHMCCIYYSSLDISGLPDKPVVKPGSSQGKGRKILVQAARENKVVYCVRPSPLALLLHQSFEVFLPARPVKGKRLFDVKIPTLSYEQKVRLPLTHSSNGWNKVTS